VFSDVSQWISTELDPFKDPFDETIEDNEPFKLSGFKDPVPYRIEESFMGLGGFVITLNTTNDVEFRN
jgi:hypothetical protein